MVPLLVVVVLLLLENITSPEEFALGGTIFIRSFPSTSRYHPQQILSLLVLSRLNVKLYKFAIK